MSTTTKKTDGGGALPSVTVWIREVQCDLEALRHDLALLRPERGFERFDKVLEEADHLLGCWAAMQRGQEPPLDPRLVGVIAALQSWVDNGDGSSDVVDAVAEAVGFRGGWVGPGGPPAAQDAPRPLKVGDRVGVTLATLRAEGQDELAALVDPEMDATWGPGSAGLILRVAEVETWGAGTGLLLERMGTGLTFWIGASKVGRVYPDIGQVWPNGSAGD